MVGPAASVRSSEQSGDGWESDRVLAALDGVPALARPPASSCDCCPPGSLRCQWATPETPEADGRPAEPVAGQLAVRDSDQPAVSPICSPPLIFPAACGCARQR